jgi:hypothetical protein
MKVPEMPRIYALDAMNTGHAGAFWFESSLVRSFHVAQAALSPDESHVPRRGACHLAA